MSKDLSQHVCYFGVNDFFPFNRAELKEAEPEIHALMSLVWDSPPRKGKK